MPKSEQVVGNAFVKAWLSLRRDFDSLSHSDVHPDLIDEWFRSMPPFLLRDAARLSTDPLVILKAAAGLARAGGSVNRRVISGLAEARSDTHVGARLRGLLIRAGDREAKQTALNELTSVLAHERLVAATALSEAGDRRGYAAFREMAHGVGGDAELAIRALGYYGGPEATKFIERELRRAPSRIALQAASGELSFRKHFPNLHRLFRERVPFDGYIVSGEGLYMTWLIAIGEAIEGGARTLSDLKAALSQIRHHVPSGRNEETYMRQLAGLTDFLSGVAPRLVGPTRPSWPTHFHDALAAICDPFTTVPSQCPELSARVTASVAVCIAAGERLGYPRLAEPTANLTSLTPGAKRVVDGNLGTSWHAIRGDSLVLEYPKGALIRELELAAFCPLSGDAPELSIEILGTSTDDTWSKRANLAGETRYFQKIALFKPSPGRFAIKIVNIKDKKQLCIAEIRVR